jgi:hypothetical protein
LDKESFCIGFSGGTVRLKLKKRRYIFMDSNLASKLMIAALGVIGIGVSLFVSLTIEYLGGWRILAETILKKIKKKQS